MLKRKELVQSLRSESKSGKIWDVIVIGGGATGLGAAVDAAARGFSVLLLESHDFAKGTSSRATKLVHGGVRYLAQGNISLVREALAERGRLARNASHLVKPLSFVIPAYRWYLLPFYWIGMKIYDALAGRLGIGASKWLSKALTRDYLPTVKLPKLQGGIQYFDGQFDDARLAISLMRTVFNLGGSALNYAPVSGLLKTTVAGKERIAGVVARDALAGDTLEFKAKAVINAAGVWVDDVRKMDNPSSKTMLAPSQGVHLVVDQRFSPTRHAMLIPKTPDGRVLFVVPWLGKTLLGTTDTPRSDAPLEPRPLDEEVAFILNTTAMYLHPAPKRSDVKSVFVGLRPLVKADDSESTAQISREHTIVVSTSGLITITGGKWTTYRSMAAEVVDKAIAVCGLDRRACNTENMLLHGATAAAHPGGIDAYGTDRREIALMPGATHRLHPELDITEAHVRFFVRNELAQTVEDVLARRHRALFLDARAAAQVSPVVARIIASELGHQEAWVKSQETHFAALASNYLL